MSEVGVLVSVLLVMGLVVILVGCQYISISPLSLQLLLTTVEEPERYR